MTYQTHNEITINTNLSSRKGIIESTYSELVRLFGPPINVDAFKSDWEWSIRFSDGSKATIYNWKNGPNYCGEDGYQADQIMEWHVGGYCPCVVVKIRSLLTGDSFHNVSDGSKRGPVIGFPDHTVDIGGEV